MIPFHIKLLAYLGLVKINPVTVEKEQLEKSPYASHRRRKGFHFPQFDLETVLKFGMPLIFIVITIMPLTSILTSDKEQKSDLTITATPIDSCKGRGITITYDKLTGDTTCNVDGTTYPTKPLGELLADEADPEFMNKPIIRQENGELIDSTAKLAFRDQIHAMDCDKMIEQFTRHTTWTARPYLAHVILQTCEVK